MALTTEQEAQLEYEKALEQARFEARNSDTSGIKLEAVRVAQTTLMENLRNAEAGSGSPITAEDITTFAESLRTYVNS